MHWASQLTGWFHTTHEVCMAYRIKNKDAVIGYYADGSWDADPLKARRYDNAGEATLTINRHNMDATIEEFLAAPVATGGTA